MNYVSPPIVEAAAQLSFSEAIDLREVSNFADSLSKIYPTKKERADVTAQVDVASGKVTADIKKVGFELRDAEGSKVVIAQTTGVAFSRLAPYPGWEEYSSWLMAGFLKLHKMVGPRKISRIGLRFINRIDVPFVDGLAYIENYINVYPKSLTHGGDKFTRYLVSFSREVDDTDNKFNILVGSTDSPVPQHAGIQLDIDAYSETPITFNLKQVKSKLDELRDLKNVVFEQTITDESRKLFGVRDA
jgi:uncharacterized protein (TIGR04255 family)